MQFIPPHVKHLIARSAFFAGPCFAGPSFIGPSFIGPYSRRAGLAGA